MISPLTLQDNIVALLRAIPELVDFVGAADNIQGYDDESQIAGDMETSELSLMGRAVMVAWAGAELPREGDTRGWQHSFEIGLKAESIQTYYGLAQLIFDGVPQPALFDAAPG